MKRIKLIPVIALCAAMSCTLAVASGCGEDYEYHYHQYTEKVAEEKYLASQATHSKSARYYYSCTCGKKGYEIFAGGLPEGHDFADGKCSCGVLEPTEGLIYELNSEGTAYSVAGLGKVPETDRVIADIYGDNLLPVTEIKHWAFRNCSQLTGVVIPDSVTEVAQESFYGCSGLTSVTVPSSVEHIGYNAFGGCDGLTSITLPFVGSSTEYKNYNKFFGYIFGAPRYYDNGSYVPASLRTVILSEGVTDIDEDAFWSCKGLTDIKLPKRLKSIGRQAFAYCSALTRMEIPKSVTSIAEYAFDSCSSLTIYCEAESKPSGWDSKWTSNWLSGNDKITVVWGYVIYD